MPAGFSRKPPAAAAAAARPASPAGDDDGDDVESTATGAGVEDDIDRASEAFTADDDASSVASSNPPPLPSPLGAAGFGQPPAAAYLSALPHSTAFAAPAPAAAGASSASARSTPAGTKRHAPTTPIAAPPKKSKPNKPDVKATAKSKPAKDAGLAAAAAASGTSKGGADDDIGAEGKRGRNTKPYNRDFETWKLSFPLQCLTWYYWMPELEKAGEASLNASQQQNPLKKSQPQKYPPLAQKIRAMTGLKVSAAEISDYWHNHTKRDKDGLVLRAPLDSWMATKFPDKSLDIDDDFEFVGRRLIEMARAECIPSWDPSDPRMKEIEWQRAGMSAKVEHVMACMQLETLMLEKGASGNAMYIAALRNGAKELNYTILTYYGYPGAQPAPAPAPAAVPVQQQTAQAPAPQVPVPTFNTNYTNHLTAKIATVQQGAGLQLTVPPLTVPQIVPTQAAGSAAPAPASASAQGASADGAGAVDQQ